MSEFEWDMNVFQYIPCYGLSLPKARLLSNIYYFNTSHVTVYLVGGGNMEFLRLNFNTSHVTVYQTNYKGNSIVDGYFNTSHVTVYQ